MSKGKLVLGIVIIAILAGCKKDLTPSVPPINIIVKVVYDTTSGSYSFPKENIAVKISNDLLGSSASAITDNSGLAIFNSVSSGLYNVAATIKISAAQYESITGIATKDSVTFNGTLANLNLNTATNNTLEVKLALGTIGDWVIKQLYYAGSNTTNGAVQRDQFIEVYNNSNDTLYADSLYIMQLAGNNTGVASTDLTKGYYISAESDILYKQFDWSKSIGMPASLGDAANRSYVYAKTLFRVPGNGKTYPVLPGKSFLIASTAINHKAPYVSSTGTSININDPSLTVDLSGANFEVYLGDIISNPLNTDIDNLNVPNLVVLDRGSGRDLIFDNPGRDAVAIFKTDADIATAWTKYPASTETSVTSATTLYYQVPNSVIIDAMQIQNPSATSSQRVARKLVATLDAGVTNVPSGQYSSQSSIRKKAKTVSGRIVLMDTNNSTNDFDYLDKAEPGGFKN